MQKEVKVWRGGGGRLPAAMRDTYSEDCRNIAVGWILPILEGRSEELKAHVMALLNVAQLFVRCILVAQNHTGLRNPQDFHHLKITVE